MTAPAALPDGTVASFVVLGAPRTKKNSMRVARVGGRTRLLQSAAAMGWADDARVQLKAAWHRAPIDHHVNMCARVFGDRRDAGDLIGFLQAIADVLQAVWVTDRFAGRVCTWPGVLVNDRLIRGFDGSRLLVDKRNPRVEIVLTRI